MASNALATAAPQPVGGRLAPQMLMMFRALIASPQRNKILLLGVALFAVIGTTAYGQIRLNAWNRPFNDALAHKDFRGFLAQLMVFGVIAGGLLVLNVAQAWLNQATKVKLSEGLVGDLFNDGLSLGAPFASSMPARWAPFTGIEIKSCWNELAKSPTARQ